MFLFGALLGWGVSRRALVRERELARSREEELARQLELSREATGLEREERLRQLERAVGAESALQGSRDLLQAMETRFAADADRVARELERSKREAEEERNRLEARYRRDLEELRTGFSLMSQEVLRGMGPELTKEVATRVQPLIGEVQTALGAYQASLQHGFQGQSDVLVQVREQMGRVQEATHVLAQSTMDFTQILKSSQHRGRWGEQTLRRVVEAAGLSPHCDFVEQFAQDQARPDLVIQLPGNRCLIVDAKVPDLDVVSAGGSESQRRDALKVHAQKLKGTIQDLAARGYPTVLRKSGREPFDQVVLFLPAESLLSTALEGDPDLIVEAARLGVLLATPATLIGFLSAISLCWRQHTQLENASRIANEAIRLHERVAKLVAHMEKLRGGIQGTVTGFNQMLASYDRMIRPVGERLRALGGGTELFPEVDDVEGNLRSGPGESAVPSSTENSPL